MNAKLKHPVKFSNTGKKLVVYDADRAATEIGEDAYERISKQVIKLLGSSKSDPLTTLIINAAATQASQIGITAVDMAEMPEDDLPEAIAQWLNNAGITIVRKDKEEENRTRSKISSSNPNALPSSFRASAPTYGVIGGMPMHPRAKWMIDELIARFPTAGTEMKYDELRYDITPTGMEDFITVTPEDVGTYAKIAYGVNNQEKREAISAYIEQAANKVACDYKDTDGSIRRYHGSLLGISEAPQPEPGTLDNAVKIGNLRYPIKIHASNVFRLYLKSRYGRIELEPQRQRIHESGFAEYQAIKNWCVSIEPYRTQEMQRKGRYTHEMPFDYIAGYADASKQTRAKTRTRAKKAAAKYAADNTTEEIRVTWKPNGTNGIKFSWVKL